MPSTQSADRVHSLDDTEIGGRHGSESIVMPRLHPSSQSPHDRLVCAFPGPTLGHGILREIIRNACNLNLERVSQRKIRAAALMSSTGFGTTQPASLRSAIGRRGPDSADDFTRMHKLNILSSREINSRI